VERDWLLLIYSIPREPTAPRVAVWRKLKRLGALLLNDAAWVLPARDATREQLRWLAAEVGEAGGEALVWEARLALGQEEALVEQFATQVEGPYGEILEELGHEGADLGALSRRYQQVVAQDYFGSELGQRVRTALASARGGAAR
jgi:DNA-binding transcriptional regulator PaaX